MAAPTILRDDVRRRLEAIGGAEIVVGIPSYNNARTIRHVVEAVTAGLAKYFPDANAVLVNSDGGSTDGTPEVVANAELGAARAILLSEAPRLVHKVITAYQGLPGKGSAFRTVFEVARLLEARACAVVDSDLRSITPEWLQLLIAPVLREGFDYVCPLYARHKFDGTITNGIVYPLVRALYGRRIRQPIGGDFGFSGRLAEHFRPAVDLRPNKFVWLGTTRPFPAFTFYFKESEHGLWRIHCYQYEKDGSTFIVETTDEAFRASGLEEADEDATIAFCEELCREELAGHRLLKNRSVWRTWNKKSLRI